MDISKSVQVELDLSYFKARPYQEEFFHALDSGYNRIFYLAARRTGKDYGCWYWCIEEAIMNGPIFILYALPTFVQARAVIWQGRDLNGKKFIDMVPKAAIESINQSTMRIIFKNGSIIWVVGANDFSLRLVGINPQVVVFSEWSRFGDNGSAWDFVSPILAAHGAKGRAIFLTTPYGSNFAKAMWELALTNPKWKCIKRTIHDCDHIGPEELEEERKSKSPQLFAQEYECSFTQGVDGAFFARELDMIRDRGQVTTIDWSPDHEVNVAIDIGMRDSTAMVYYQVIGSGAVIRVIDFEMFRDRGLDHVAALIQSKPYKYNKFFSPHDGEVREWTRGGLTRVQIAAQLGINFHVLPRQEIPDSIETCRMTFPKLWIDERKCAKLISCIENYFKEWDENLQCYKTGAPVKNWARDGADAFRYMCQSLDLCQKGMSSEEFENIKRKALYGRMTTLPNQFQRPNW